MTTTESAVVIFFVLRFTFSARLSFHPSFAPSYVKTYFTKVTILASRHFEVMT